LNKWLVYWSRIGPGLAGIGIGRNPDGAVVEISAAMRGERKRKALPPPADTGPERPPGEALESPPAAPAGIPGGA
jgi:hypothetical protein